MIDALLFVLHVACTAATLGACYALGRRLVLLLLEMERDEP